MNKPKEIPEDVEIIEEDITHNGIHTGSCEDMSELGLYAPNNEEVDWLK